MSLFDCIGLIHNKSRFPTEDELSKYSSFMGNRAISQYQEFIFYAQALNEKPNIPKEANFSFYFNCIPKNKKRWSWAKKNNDYEDKINLLKEYLDLSSLKARELIPLIDSLDIWDDIKAELDKGGAQNAKSKSKKQTISLNS